jgi:hypothetical protein
MFSEMRLRMMWLVLVLVVAACQPDAAAPTSVALVAVTPVKLLATVYISPTPDAAQQQATLLAATATATAPPNTPTATATVYVGVFMGEAGSLDDSAALAAINQLQAQRDAPTAVPDRLSVCPLQPDESFGTLWRAAGALADELGCPAALPTPFSGISQVYERGVMYRTPDGELWAFTPRGDPTGQYWYAEQPPQVSVEGVSAPTNLRAPGQRFAAFWQAQPQLRDRLGFAQTDEVRTTFTVQLFQNGALLLDNSAAQVWLMVGTGDTGPALGPY